MQIHEIHKVEEKNMAEIININTSDKGVAAQSTDITSVGKLKRILKFLLRKTSPSR